MSFKTKDIALQAMLAGLYVAITLILMAVSYGPTQFRLAEILIILVLMNKKNKVGIILGTFIANFFSSNGVIDVVVGTMATIIAVELMIRIRNKKIAYLMPAVINAIFIGLMLHYVSALPLLITATEVFVSEVIVTLVPWFLIGDSILENTRLKEIFA